MLPQLRRYLLENWGQIFTGEVAPREIAFLVQATGVTKVCCFVFADRAKEPRCVAKMTRSPRDNALLAREYEIIRYVRARGQEFARATVPGPLHIAIVANHLVGIERYLPGQPMDGLMAARALDDKGLQGYLDLAADWLLECQQQTGALTRRLPQSKVQHYLLAPIDLLRSTATLTEEESAFLDHTAAEIVARSQQPLPLVFNHGDFRPGNILVGDNSLKVIDWEFGAPVQVPLLDLFGLLSRSYLRLHGVEEIDGYLQDYMHAFQNVFFQGGLFGHLTLRYVRRGCQALEIDPSWLSVLFALYLVIESNRFHEFLSQRARHSYVFMLRSKNELPGSYAEQLGRQKNVWLLGYLAQNEGKLVFAQSPLVPRSRSHTRFSEGAVR